MKNKVLFVSLVLENKQRIINDALRDIGTCIKAIKIKNISIKNGSIVNKSFFCQFFWRGLLARFYFGVELFTHICSMKS